MCLVVSYMRTSHPKASAMLYSLSDPVIGNPQKMQSSELVGVEALHNVLTPSVTSVHTSRDVQHRVLLPALVSYIDCCQPELDNSVSGKEGANVIVMCPIWDVRSHSEESIKHCLLGREESPVAMAKQLDVCMQQDHQRTVMYADHYT